MLLNLVNEGFFNVVIVCCYYVSREIKWEN